MSKFETPEQLVEAVTGHEAKLAEIEKERGEWKTHYEKLVKDGADQAEVKTMVDRAIRRLDAVEAGLSRAPGGEQRQGKSIGEMLVENEAVQDLAKQIKGSGWVRGRAATIPIKGGFFLNPELKTTITSTAVGSSTPGILVPMRLEGIIPAGIRRVRVRDLMPRIPTTANAVEFVKENVFTNNASPTAETISKPESALTFTIDSETVKTIAHWIPASRQILDDFPGLQAFANMRLLSGLKDIEDYELVSGDGTGQHLSGLSTEAGAYDTSRNVSADTKIDKVNHYIAQIEDANLDATGIIMRPADWRKIQLIKQETGGANTGSYLLGGPSGDAAPVLWGLPVATSQQVQANTLFVGAFATHTYVVDRMEATVDISTEHADYFIRNMVAIRAEERIAFVMTRSDAVIYGAY